MTRFFEAPILNSPYDYPNRHRELDESGKPTQSVKEGRRWVSFLTAIPASRRQAGPSQPTLLNVEEDQDGQQYQKSIIGGVREAVDKWRSIRDPSKWQVTPETARLLAHWRHHSFNHIRPFFCQVEAAETAIWLTEVAPQMGKEGERFLNHLRDSNAEANPEIFRLALKLATGALQVQVLGVDVFDPSTGAVRSDNADGIACWFIDTDYDEESCFVRHAYFMGANDPYKALKTTLKAEINVEAWESLNSDTSRPFPKPKTGRIAVKVINHLGDEVMKVFRV